MVPDIKPLPYDLDGQHFPSQAALEREIKARLNKPPLDTQFRDTLIAAVVNTLHPDVVAAQQRTDGYFRKVSWRVQVERGMPTAEMYRGGYVLMAHFQPLNAWRDVTAFPWKRHTGDAEFVEALRAKASKTVPRPLASDRCCVPGCNARGGALEYHHVFPEFAAIVAEALKLIIPSERECRFGYSKFAAYTYCLADFIPDDHPAVRYIRAAHVGNVWEWRCKRHHQEATYAIAR